ncbi:AAA family ATPase [Arthrobacter sp. Soil764]|uniref:AAA family ATPase n=1 Tax=Arthrobacter sp. Soil764 TaxID=1736403 RepID=UPI0009EA236F|nr:AAA family ATPase [Arthrobacter sp. Soil764]
MSELRMAELVVENFRSISGRCVIPLDGSITLVHGANGAGKTSLLSAIELAATGRVGFLEDQGGDARALLRNNDFQLGSVRLSLSDHSNAPRVGSFELNGDHVVGNAALTLAEQTYFLERSFLPQTALGRLLETYTETGKQVDTALVRFVKSLVGLDELDALIDGLHASGDKRRSKRIIHAWSRGADELEASRRRHAEAAGQLKAATEQFNDHVNLLRELVGDPASTNVGDLLRKSNERSRGSETSRSELARLEELQANVDAVARMRQQVDSPLSGGSDLLESARAEEAQFAFEAWKSEIGDATLAKLNRIRETSLGLPAATIGNLTEAYQEALERAAFADHQYAGAVAADLERAAKIDALDRRIQELDREISAVESRAQAFDVSADARVLIEILQMTIPIVDSEHCPVCDQQFSGSGSLAEHYTDKLDRLSANSSQLVEAERELTKLREERLSKVRQAVLQKSLPQLAAGEPMDETIRSLNRLSDSVDEGSRLRRDIQTTQAKIAEMSAYAARRAIMTDRVAEVAQSLGLSTRGLPVPELEVHLGREIATRIQLIRSGEIQRNRERDARENIEDAQREVARWERVSREAEQEVSALQAQLTTAESRMASSRQVLQIAERTRSKLINEVFDQSLNSLWAQLFGRFAPSERFTPRFVKQTESSRSVDVRLETELPGGQVSGSPGAMLSYGNTNSAALSLFMALHLSAPSELRWLIFDDPVQSMDDIHVANFAAIIRQLAFVHQRQVVIAIHQPELFDYLSLALAPSDGTHSLVRVTLDRGAGTTLAHIDRVEYVEEPLLHGAT